MFADHEPPKSKEGRREHDVELTSKGVAQDRSQLGVRRGAWVLEVDAVARRSGHRLDEPDEERLLVAEVRVDGLLRHGRCLGDGVHRHAVVAAFEERRDRGVDDRFSLHD